MEVLFSQLKRKDVINVNDGKHLGRVCDVTFTVPENKLCGITVTGCKGFSLAKKDIFIPMCDIIKIGTDAILTNLSEKGEQKPHEKPEERCPPERPPHGSCPPRGNCPPPCPPQNNFEPCPPCPPSKPRRNYEEYE